VGLRLRSYFEASSVDVQMYRATHLSLVTLDFSCGRDRDRQGFAR
jgi:hypothetical protein